MPCWSDLGWSDLGGPGVFVTGAIRACARAGLVAFSQVSYFLQSDAGAIRMRPCLEWGA